MALVTDDIMEEMETDRGDMDDMDPMDVHQNTDRTITSTVNTNYTISQMEQSLGNNQRYQARIPSPMHRGGRQRPYSVTQTPSANPMTSPNLRVASRHEQMSSDSQIYENMAGDEDISTPVISPMPDDYDHRQPSHHHGSHLHGHDHPNGHHIRQQHLNHDDHHFHDDDEVMKGMSEDALMQGMTKGGGDIPYISADEEGDTSAERQTVDFYYDPQASNRNLEEEESEDQMQTSGFIAADYANSQDVDYEDEYYEDDEEEEEPQNWKRVRTVSEV